MSRYIIIIIVVIILVNYIIIYIIYFFSLCCSRGVNILIIVINPTLFPISGAFHTGSTRSGSATNFNCIRARQPGKPAAAVLGRPFSLARSIHSIIIIIIIMLVVRTSMGNLLFGRRTFLTAE